MRARDASPEVERRRAASYPGPRPFGWYHLHDADALRPGQVARVEALGTTLAVFRTRAGDARVLEACCPHLGADLAAGRVVEDCLECPFHGWRFPGDGAPAQVPSVERPPRVGARAWPVRERHGLLLAYHGPLGPAGQPPWEPDCWPELETPRFRLRGRHAPRDVRMHLLEFAENSVDFAHFARLHGRLRLPWTSWPVPGLGIRHEARWEPDAERPHAARFYDLAELSFRGRPLPSTRAEGEALFLGPAALVAFRIRLPRAGDVVIFQTHTPVTGEGEPLRLRVRFRWWAEAGLPRLLASYVVGNWVSQWWQDVAVWERKWHLPRPVPAPGDGPLHALRRWFWQFYPEAQP